MLGLKSHVPIAKKHVLYQQTYVYAFAGSGARMQKEIEIFQRS